jgi:hypothetical protein
LKIRELINRDEGVGREEPWGGEAAQGDEMEEKVGYGVWQW